MQSQYNWNIFISDKVIKSLSKIPEKDKNKIYIAIDGLRTDPVLGPNIKPLNGNVSGYRLRVGNYRIIYNLDFNIIQIIILKIAHRKEIYKK